MKIAGLDVSKDNVTVWLLDESDAARDPRDLYVEGTYDRLYTKPEDIKTLLAMRPDVAVLEPTGVNYSRLWVTKLHDAGVEVLLVGHKQLKTYRDQLGLPDKDDPADALALGLYGWQHRGREGRFVRHRDPVVGRMREIVLRIHHCNRIQSPLVNRIKQDLAWQFPEMAKATDNAYVFWRWLAGEGESVKYEAMHKKTCGIGLADFTRGQAAILHQVRQQEDILSWELRELAKDERFRPYLKAFSRFGFGERVSAMLLTQIYPLENYLTDDRQPIVKVTRSKLNKDKVTTKHISERKFSKALGCAPQREWSGDGKKTSKAGSQLCRTALWQWVFTRIEVQKNRPTSLPTVNWTEGETTLSGTIADYFDWQRGRVPVKLARARTAAKTVKALFYELITHL